MPERNADSPIVTSADFIRNFGKAQRSTHAIPTFISTHGRVTHAFLDIEVYLALRARHDDGLEESRPLPPLSTRLDGGPDPLKTPLCAFIEWLKDGIVLCDRDLRIVLANRSALSLADRQGCDLAGYRFGDILPADHATVICNAIARTAASGVPDSIEAVSALRPDRRLRFDAFPVEEGVCVRIEDVTDALPLHEKSGRTPLAAINATGSIGFARLCLQGLVEEVNPALCDLIGIASDRIVGARFIETVSRPHRQDFNARLARVLSGGADETSQISLMTNHGDEAPVRVTQAAMKGRYGTEGAVLLVTRSARPADDLPDRDERQRPRLFSWPGEAGL